MFNSMVINESDLNYENSINDINIEYEKSYSAFRKSFLDLDYEDYEFLKNSLLFKNWSPNTLKLFIEDSRIFLKKFKYKDIIAKEIDTNNNIYILKSGYAKCYIRISRSQIKKHQKTLESNATSPYFTEPSIDKQKTKYLRENLLKSQSNEHSLKSKYMDYRREKTIHSLSRSTEKIKNHDRRVTFNHFHYREGQSLPKQKNSVFTQNFNYNSPSIMIKPMSAIVDPKGSINKETFRSSSTNMVRMNKAIKHFANKQNKLNDNLNNPIEIVSSHNIMEDNTVEKHSSTSHNLLEEINCCHNIKTRLPEIWNEIYQFRNANSCFINLIELKPGQIFGLSDFLFNEKRQQENFDMGKSNYLEENEQVNEHELTESNKYHLIVDSKYAECYIIDKESYLKFMLSFTTDKTIINKYLDQMRNTCIKLPSVKTINEDFFQDLTWKLYKKRAYDELVNLNLRKSCR